MSDSSGDKFFEMANKKNTGEDPRHGTGSLRLLPSGPDLVQIAHSAGSPVKFDFTRNDYLKERVKYLLYNPIRQRI